MRRARQLSLKECYQILALDKNATLDDVKRAYRRRAFELHPDLHPGNPEAGAQFQRLNEAYVALSKILQAKEDAEEKKQTAQQARQEAENKRQAEAAEERAHAYSDAQYTTSGPDPSEDPKREATTEAADNEAETRKRATDAYAQEDVLRDLLNDPFARRVFEDIYSQVNKEEAAPPHGQTAPAPPPPPKPRKVSLEWGRSKLNLDFSHGIKGVVKGWLRSQIDEVQTFKLPASSLVPRARIRLQIRRGLSEDLVTVEITLPPDFVMGKPVRLKGLGKRVGPWQGDLYLTLEPK